MTSLKPPRVLIVEDEPDIASVLAEYLRAGIGDTLAKWYEARVLCAREASLPLTARLGLETARQVRDVLLESGPTALADAAAGRLSAAFVDVIDAVIAGGRPRVILGSRMTQSGISFGLTMPTLSSSSGTRTMLLGVVSEPVPAVVGIINVGRPRRAIGALLSNSRSVTSLLSRTAINLATSIALPPPTPMTMSQLEFFAASNKALACSTSGSGGVSSRMDTAMPAASRSAFGRSIRPARATPLSLMISTREAP
mgnify:CR=1 FL=1